MTEFTDTWWDPLVQIAVARPVLVLLLIPIGVVRLVPLHRFYLKHGRLPLAPGDVHDLVACALGI